MLLVLHARWRPGLMPFCWTPEVFKLTTERLYFRVITGPGGWVGGYWGLTPQQQPGSYQGGEMMMKSVIWWRKPEYPEETTDPRQVTDETFHTYGLCPVRGLNLGRRGGGSKSVKGKRWENMYLIDAGAHIAVSPPPPPPEQHLRIRPKVCPRKGSSESWGPSVRSYIRGPRSSWPGDYIRVTLQVTIS